MHRMDSVVICNARARLTVDDIRRLAVPSLRRHGAMQAFLIGSFARGSADAWSDIDLVVVMPTDRPFVERPLVLNDLLDDIPLAIDLFVYTPQEFSAGVERDRGIFHVVSREGVRIL